MIIKNKKNENRFRLKLQPAEAGFSLIESIIYLALFVTLSAVIIDSLIVLSISYTEVRVNRDLVDSISVPIERMTREIRLSSSWVSGSSSVFGTNPGKLTLNIGSSNTESFSLVSGAIQFVDSAGNVNNITSSNVSVDSLIFRNISTAKGSAVKIEMVLHSLRVPLSRSVSISDTVVLRQSY